jgi:hypothetical protein
MSSASKHKKLVRGDVESGRLRIQPRDALLLQDLASYRFLDTAQILALHPGSRRNLQQRLTLLFREGYMERPASQVKIKLPSEHLIYALGRKGAELIIPEKQVLKVWTRRNAESTRPNLQHALMISQFRVTLTLALQKYGGKITRWVQGYDLRDALIINGKPPQIVPDGFCTVDIEDGEHYGHWNFFFEADRSSMSNHQFLDKLKVYCDWWRAKTYNERFDLKRVRVLTVTDTIGRKKSICDNWKSDARRGTSDMFLFACEKDYSLENPDPILQNIWLSAKDGAEHDLID